MNLSTQHLCNAGLPTPRFLRQRAKAEARLGVGAKLVKFFCDEPRANGYGEFDALLAENAKIRASVAEARKALARAFGDESA